MSFFYRRMETGYVDLGTDHSSDLATRLRVARLRRDTLLRVPLGELTCPTSELHLSEAPLQTTMEVVMQYIVETKKTFEQACSDLEVAIGHNGFGVHDPDDR
jgi:hypothetical protein